MRQLQLIQRIITTDWFFTPKGKTYIPLKSVNNKIALEGAISELDDEHKVLMIVTLIQMKEQMFKELIDFRQNHVIPLLSQTAKDVLSKE